MNNTNLNKRFLFIGNQVSPRLGFYDSEIDLSRRCVWYQNKNHLVWKFVDIELIHLMLNVGQGRHNFLCQRPPMREYETRDTFRILFRSRYEGVIQGPRSATTPPPPPILGNHWLSQFSNRFSPSYPWPTGFWKLFILFIHTYVLECRHPPPLCTMFENILKRLIRISAVSRDRHSTTVQ
jgi:hypothetical protein